LEEGLEGRVWWGGFAGGGEIVDGGGMVVEQVGIVVRRGCGWLMFVPMIARRRSKLSNTFLFTDFPKYYLTIHS